MNTKHWFTLTPSEKAAFARENPATKYAKGFTSKLPANFRKLTPDALYHPEAGVAKDKDGNTPLHHLALNEDEYELVAQHPKFSKVRNNDGQTPTDLANDDAPDTKAKVAKAKAVPKAKVVKAKVVKAKAVPEVKTDTKAKAVPKAKAAKAKAVPKAMPSKKGKSTAMTDESWFDLTASEQKAFAKDNPKTKYAKGYALPPEKLMILAKTDNNVVYNRAVATLTNARGQTPLHILALKSKIVFTHPKVAKVKDAKGNTPLHIAAGAFHAAVSKHDFATRVKNTAGATPADLAANAKEKSAKERE